MLIVSRLNNFEKRLDRALKIWKKIETGGFDDWHLYITFLTQYAGGGVIENGNDKRKRG